MLMVNLVATLYRVFKQFSRYTHKTEIAIRLTAWKDKHIFKLNQIKYDL